MSVYDTGKHFGKYAANTASSALMSMILWGLVTNIICWVFNILFFWLPIFYSDKRNRAISSAENFFKNNCDLLCQNCNYWVPRTQDAVCPVCGVTIDILYLNRVEAQEAGYSDPDKFIHDVIDGKVTSPSAERWQKRERLLGFTEPLKNDKEDSDSASAGSVY